MERDASAWAAARDVGSATRALVARLSAADSADAAAAVLRDALAWFAHPPPFEAESAAADGADAGAADGAGAVHPAWAAALRRHAAALGWPLLQRLWLEDQFSAWATAVLTGARRACQRCQTRDGALGMGHCRTGSCDARAPRRATLAPPAVAAGEWLPEQPDQATPPKLLQLVQDTFALCPAAAALAALTE